MLDPVEDKVVCLWSLELWSHVTGTVDGCEGKIAVFLINSSNLVVHVIVCEVGSVGPSSGLNPVDGSLGWYSTIGISGELEDSDSGILQSFVNPLRGCSIDVIVYVVAQSPWLGNLATDVEGILYSLIIQVFNDWLTKSAWRKHANWVLVFVI